MRKGTVGDWANYFSPEMSDKFDSKSNEMFADVDLKFSENLSWSVTDFVCFWLYDIDIECLWEFPVDNLRLWEFLSMFYVNYILFFWKQNLF